MQPLVHTPPAVQRHPGRPRILIAEDDLDIAHGLEVLLRGAYDVRAETCAREALGSFTVEPADLLVLDYQLPDMNGLRLYETICRRFGLRPPAVMLSAFPSRRRACLGTGIRSFLEKPCEPAALFLEIEQALLEW